MNENKREEIRQLDHRAQARERLPIFFGSADNYIHGLKEVMGNSTDEIMNNFENGEIDIESINIVNKVIKLDNEFREFMEYAGKIVSEEGFTKKIYSIDVGTEKPLDKIVLNFDKPGEIKKIRKSFILEEMGK